MSPTSIRASAANRCSLGSEASRHPSRCSTAGTPTLRRRGQSRQPRAYRTCSCGAVGSQPMEEREPRAALRTCHASSPNRRNRADTARRGDFARACAAAARTLGARSSNRRTRTSCATAAPVIARAAAARTRPSSSVLASVAPSRLKSSTALPSAQTAAARTAPADSARLAARRRLSVTARASSLPSPRAADRRTSGWRDSRAASRTAAADSSATCASTRAADAERKRDAFSTSLTTPIQTDPIRSSPCAAVLLIESRLCVTS